MAKTTYPKGITNFKDVLSTQYQKPFENISEGEIKNDMVARGYSRKDVRDVVQGFRKFKRKDAEFTFDDGGFRINTTEGALRGSGRRKGRTVGQSGLADMLNLGQDVSKFAQFAEGVARDVNIPDVIEPETDIIEDTEIDLGDVLADVDETIEGPKREVPSTATDRKRPTTPDRAKVEERFGIPEAAQAPNAMPEEEAGILEDPEGFLEGARDKWYDFIAPFSDVANEALYYGTRAAKGPGAFYGLQPYDEFRKEEDARKATAKEFGLEYVHELEPFKAPVGIAGPSSASYLANLKRFYKPLTNAFKSGKGMKGAFQKGMDYIKNIAPKSKEALREIQRQGIKAEQVAAKSKQAREAAKAAKIQPPIKEFAKDAFNTTKSTAKTVKDVVSKAKSDLTTSVSQFAEKLRRTGQRYGTMPDGTRIEATGAGFRVLRQGGKLETKFSKMETPVASIDPALGNRVWQDQKDDSPLMFSREYYSALEGEGVPATSPKTSEDRSLLGYLKRGGKVPMLRDGGPAKYQDIVGAPYTEAGLENLGTGDRFTGIEGTLPDSIGIPPPESLEGIDLSGYNPATTKEIDKIESQRQRGVYNTETSEFGDVFQAAGLGEDGQGLTLNDVIHGAAVYGTPAAKAIAEQISSQKLKDTMYPNLKSPELQVGAVRDIRRPDFSTPYRVATADLGRENMNRQFQLAQNEQAEKAFEAAQDESKIRQEEGIRENMNKQAMIDADIANRAETIRANIDANRYMRSIGVRDQAILGGAESVAFGATQREGISSSERTELAKAMIRSGDVKGGLALMKRRKRSGGKLSKFSNGN